MKSLPKKQQRKETAEKIIAMPLAPANYLMIAFGVMVIAASYLGMFFEQKIDGIFALYISPITLIGAYLWIVFAILYRPKAENKQAG